ncbi:hypothetical protein R1flu_026392 [Riccia fluitans]|uniref:Uncharacterized protein n=1 Tax=Riccia fluitans TaxID=41844 RepID=A0ABD1XFU0_9MARC
MNEIWAELVRDLSDAKDLEEIALRTKEILSLDSPKLEKKARILEDKAVESAYNSIAASEERNNARLAAEDFTEEMCASNALGKFYSGSLRQLGTMMMDDFDQPSSKASYTLCKV